MNQDDDLKLIEHTEKRAQHMLRLCELARDGIKFREPGVTEANRLAREALQRPVRMGESRQAPGGRARAAALSPERRSAISKTAANTRWGSKKK